MADSPYFYYDRSKRVPLIESETWIVVHLEPLFEALGRERGRALVSEPEEILKRFGLLRCSALTEAETERLRAVDAFELTFAHDKSSVLTIVLGEILCTKQVSNEQLQFVNSLGISRCMRTPATDDETPGILVDSKRGRDVLAIIQALHDRHPSLKPSPNFLRFHLPRQPGAPHE